MKLKRITAAVLSLLMLIALLPSFALAENADGDGEEILYFPDFSGENEDYYPQPDDDFGDEYTQFDDEDDGGAEDELPQEPEDTSDDDPPEDDTQEDEDENLFEAADTQETEHAVPKILTAANHENYLILRWTAVEDAVGYRVAYRRGSEPWSVISVPLSSVDSTGVPRKNFTDFIQGGTYTFIVYADFEDGSFTKSASATQLRMNTPALKAEFRGDYIQLNWTSTEGGSCYKVYYRAMGTGGWQLYANVRKSETGVKIKDSVIKENGYLPLESGKSYEFAVIQAISVPGITSGFPTDPPYLTVPQKISDNEEATADGFAIISAKNTEEGITLLWTAAENAVSYRVECRLSTGELQSEEIPASAEDTAELYGKSFSGLEEGSTCSFTVFALLDNGTQISTQSVAQVRLSAPEVTAKFCVDYVQLEWSGSQYGSRYYVYYREKGSDTWLLYAWVKNSVTNIKIKDGVLKQSGLPPIEEGREYEFAVVLGTTAAGICSGFQPNPPSVSTIRTQSGEAETEPGNVEITEKSITVHIHAGESLLMGIQKGYALLEKNPACELTVHVCAGTYDIISEYISVYGADYFSSYKGDDDGVQYNDCKNGNYDYGIWIDNMTLICDSGVKITANYMGKNIWVTRYFSAFAVGSHAVIEGLSVEAANLRYAIHPDFHPDPENESLVFKNCVFSNDSPQRNYQTFGCGLGVHTKMLIENCVFRTPESSIEDNIAVLIHNNVNPNAQSEVTLKGCAFEGKGYARIAWYGESKLETTVTFTECTWTVEPRLERALESSENENMSIVYKNAAAERAKLQLQH